MMATSVSAPVFLWNARLPVAISYRIVPSVNWSERKSTVCPLACSGDMYPAVPMTVPGCVAPTTVGNPVTSSETVSVSLASPKSRILTKPSFDSIRFSGFKSRCTIPAECALASPSAVCTATSRSRFIGTGSPEAISSRSVFPSTSSIAMNVVPSLSPMS